MDYKLVLNFPDGWDVTEESGHFEAKSGDVTVECTLGQMPEDEGAEDVAFANYVDMVGFEPGEEDEQVLQCFMFNGRKAYGFSVYDEDESILNVFCQEPRKGLCQLFVVNAPGVEEINTAMSIAEKSVKIISYICLH